MNIILDRDDYKDLISGEIVVKNDIQIALSDIGYDLMLEILTDLIEVKKINDELKKNDLTEEYIPGYFVSMNCQYVSMCTEDRPLCGENHKCYLKNTEAYRKILKKHGVIK